jgi:hypothetical protein
MFYTVFKYTYPCILFNNNTLGDDVKEANLIKRKKLNRLTAIFSGIRLFLKLLLRLIKLKSNIILAFSCLRYHKNLKVQLKKRNLIYKQLQYFK